MGLEIYNMVKDILGTLPVELNWVYGFGTIFVLAMVIVVAASPFVFIYKWFSN